MEQVQVVVAQMNALQVNIVQPEVQVVLLVQPEHIVEEELEVV